MAISSVLADIYFHVAKTGCSLHSIAAGPLQIIPLLNFGNEWGSKLVAKFILGNPGVKSEQQIPVSVIPGFYRHNPRGLTYAQTCNLSQTLHG